MGSTSFPKCRNDCIHFDLCYTFERTSKEITFFCSCLFISNVHNGKRVRVEKAQTSPSCTESVPQIQHKVYFQHFIHQTAKCNQSKKFCRSFRLAEHDDDTIRQSEHVPVSILISFIIIRCMIRLYIHFEIHKSNGYVCKYAEKVNGQCISSCQDFSVEFLLNGIRVFHANSILSHQVFEKMKVVLSG